MAKIWNIYVNLSCWIVHNNVQQRSLEKNWIHYELFNINLNIFEKITINKWHQPKYLQKKKSAFEELKKTLAVSVLHVFYAKEMWRVNMPERHEKYFLKETGNTWFWHCSISVIAWKWIIIKKNWLLLGFQNFVDDEISPNFQMICFWQQKSLAHLVLWQARGYSALFRRACV